MNTAESARRSMADRTLKTLGPVPQGSVAVVERDEVGELQTTIRPREDVIRMLFERFDDVAWIATLAAAIRRSALSTHVTIVTFHHGATVHVRRRAPGGSA